MSYLVLARKWRPQTFDDLIGQEHVSQTLKNAIGSGRVAHAFLFTGARGVGKTSAARILAKALNCEQEGTVEPCNACPACSEITAGNSVDVFEIDGASNTSVEDVRELRENIKYLPARCRSKIFIIDEVHMLSTSAFNALLKTLEEPPPHVKFIFATTEPHKVPITILSRCQRFDFKRIPLPAIIARLRHIVDQEGVSISDDSLTVVARKGDGSMRDSLSTLDQVLAFCGDQVRDDDVVTLLGVVDRRLVAETVEAVLSRDAESVLDVVRRVDSFGHNMRHFCRELIGRFRDLLVVKTVRDPAGLTDLAPGELAEIREEALRSDPASLQRYLTTLLRCEGEMAQATYPRLHMEMALLKMATQPPLIPIDDLLERIRLLEEKGRGIVSSSAPVWGGQQSRPTATPSSAPAPTQPAAPADTSPNPRQPQPASVPESPEPTWPRFVAFVKQKKPIIGSSLEHGRPLSVTLDRVEVGFSEGYYLTTLRDPAYAEALQTLAREFFTPETEIAVVSTIGRSGSTPPSLAEKKSLDAEEHQRRLRMKATSHPLVAAALEIFDGELGETVALRKEPE